MTVGGARSSSLLQAFATDRDEEQIEAWGKQLKFQKLQVLVQFLAQLVLRVPEMPDKQLREPVVMTFHPLDVGGSVTSRWR